MNLRVVSGILKGRKCTIPPRDREFRPTRERVRTAVADLLMPRIPGSDVADICAGSGIFGFEMISRGAGRVTFVERDRFRGRLIEAHAERFGVRERCQVFVMDAREFAGTCARKYDIIYFDPPYDDESLESLLPSLAGLLSGRGMLVHERRSRKKGAKHGTIGEPLFSADIRVYGETEIQLFEARRNS